MAQDTTTGDALSIRPRRPRPRRGGREARAANLFDIRRIIGGLFLLYGVVLFILGLGASEADIQRAAGVNVNLCVGISLLVTAALFIAWSLIRPLGRELEDDEPAPDARFETDRFSREPAGAQADPTTSV